MINNLKKSFKETTIIVLPICIIVSIIALVFGLSKSIITSFVISSFLLIVGISLFTFGADLSMMMIGEKLGSTLIKSKKISIIIGVILLIGIMITIAEPDLRVLAEQIPSIPTTTLILAISLGVGIMLMIAVMKILFKLNFRTIVIISYAIIFLLTCLVPERFIPISFDSSGVTTGPISVPFILALGIGLTAFRTDSNTKNDTFGLIGLCSIGPKIMVLILGLLYTGTNTYDTSIYNSNLPLLMQYIEKFFECIKSVSISLSPIILLFIIFNFIKKGVFSRKQIKQVIIGLIATFLGLCMFLTGVDVGFMKTGFILGQGFINKDLAFYIIPFISVIGFLVVFAEPAVKILTNEVEEITEGSITSNIMRITISVGVIIALLLALFRVIYQVPIFWFLVVFYAFAMLLTFITPKMFTSIAFDTGGSVCGPLTATFILPFMIGVCLANGSDIMLDAFGLIAFIATSPLITIQILGIIFKIKTKREINNEIDEKIITYDWRNFL